MDCREELGFQSTHFVDLKNKYLRRGVSKQGVGDSLFSEGRV